MSSSETERATFEHVPGRFRAVIDGEQVAELDYVASPGVWDMVHTFAEPRLRGTGLASQLVGHAMDAARAADVKVVLTCPYLPNWMGRHPEYADLVRS